MAQKKRKSKPSTTTQVVEEASNINRETIRNRADLQHHQRSITFDAQPAKKENEENDNTSSTADNFTDSYGTALRGGEYLVYDRFGSSLLPYSHAAIYIGDGLVIHFNGEPGGNKTDATIKKDTLERAANGQPFRVKKGPRNEEERQEIIDNAHRKLGNSGYKLYGNNCQNFCSWCYGKGTSDGNNAATVLASLTVSSLSFSLLYERGRRHFWRNTIIAVVLFVAAYYLWHFISMRG